MPILSVGAITIRLWIISLDHCFPLLCWLGAIHPPSPSPVTAAVKLPVPSPPLPSLPPPPPHPQSHLVSLICPPLRHSIYWKASCAGAKASGECLWALLGWGNPSLCFSPPHMLTFTSTDRQMTQPSCYLWRKSLNGKQRWHITMDGFSWQRLTGVIWIRKRWRQFVTERAGTEQKGSWFKGSYYAPWGTIRSDLLHLLPDNAPEL